MKDKNFKSTPRNPADKPQSGLKGIIFIALMIGLVVYVAFSDNTKKTAKQNESVAPPPYSPPEHSTITTRYSPEKLADIQSSHQAAKNEWLGVLDSFALLYPNVCIASFPDYTLQAVSNFAKNNLILHYMDRGTVECLEEKPLTANSKKLILIMDPENTFESDGDTLDFTAMYFHPKRTIFVKEKYAFSKAYKTTILAHEIRHAMNNEYSSARDTHRARLEMSAYEFQFAVQSAIGRLPYKELLDEEVRMFQRSLASGSTEFPRSPYNPRFTKIFGPSLSAYETNLRRNMFHLQALLQFASTDPAYASNREYAKLKFIAGWLGIDLE